MAAPRSRLGRPTQFHGVPFEERAIDANGNRLPWAYDYPESANFLLTLGSTNTYAAIILQLDIRNDSQKKKELLERLAEDLVVCAHPELKHQQRRRMRQ